jgi:hypothetical protein
MTGIDTDVSNRDQAVKWQKLLADETGTVRVVED